MRSRIDRLTNVALHPGPSP